MLRIHIAKNRLQKSQIGHKSLWNLARLEHEIYIADSIGEEIMVHYLNILHQMHLILERKGFLPNVLTLQKWNLL